MTLKKGMKGHALRVRQDVYVFEYGEGKVVKMIETGKGQTEEKYRVETDSGTYDVPSSSCFEMEAERKYRHWEYKNARVQITYDPINLTFHGSPTWGV